jgi:hypothetical protein
VQGVHGDGKAGECGDAAGDARDLPSRVQVDRHHQGQQSC